jgi:hypothetical protein
LDISIPNSQPETHTVTVGTGDSEAVGEFYLGGAGNDYLYGSYLAAC